MNETDLIIEYEETPIPFPPFSARECTQTLTFLPQGTLRRTLVGDLVNLGGHLPQKFCSTLTCQDQVAPAFGAFKRGTLLKVGCITSLTEVIPPLSRSFQLARLPLSFSLYDVTGQRLPSPPSEGQTLLFPEGFPGGLITYRPWLWMMVTQYHLEMKEWGPEISWTLELEER